MPRKRGAQPGNRNAYKHGFYSGFFSSFEKRALSRISAVDISGEIGILRVNVNRFMQAYTSSLEELDYEQRLAGLRAITLAVGRIACLERLRALVGKNIDTDREIMEALEKFQSEQTKSSHPPE